MSQFACNHFWSYSNGYYDFPCLGIQGSFVKEITNSKAGFRVNNTDEKMVHEASNTFFITLIVMILRVSTYGVSQGFIVLHN
jgi:hypothetical protein